MRATLSIFGAFISSRLLCALFVYLGHINRPYLAAVPGGWQGVNNWWLNPWTTYDSFWFLQIAAKGYDIQSTAFFPLYPAMLRCFGPDQLNMALAGVILSNVFFLAALCVVYRLTRLEHSIEMADVTIWLLAYSPAAAFFSAVYTESLFLLLLGAAFLALRNNQWLQCSGYAGAAALTRNPGVLIAAALWLENRKTTNQRTFIQRYLPPAFSLVAFILVQVWFSWRFKELLAGVKSQELFYRALEWPWTSILNDIIALYEPGHFWSYYLLVATSLVMTIGPFLLILYGWHKVAPGYILLVVGITLMNLIYTRELVPHTLGQIRYMSALFPFAQLLAFFVIRHNKRRFTQFFILAVYVYLFFIMSYLFGIKVLF